MENSEDESSAIDENAELPPDLGKRKYENALMSPISNNSLSRICNSKDIGIIRCIAARLMVLITNQYGITRIDAQSARNHTMQSEEVIIADCD